MIWQPLLLVAISLPSVPLCRWLWTYGLPEKYVKPAVPALVSDIPITLDTDYRGLV